MDRFWSKVDIGDNDECWEWEASTNGVGYGKMWFDGDVVDAHRISYELHNPDFDKSMMVLHTCDNRLCVNPNHLYLGDYSDNMQDAYDRGRRNGCPGEEGNNKLTREEVIEIRKRAKDEEYQDLADEFGIESDGRISDIVNRKAWSHVEEPKQWR